MINNLSALNWLMGKVHKDDDCNLEAWLTLDSIKGSWKSARIDVCRCVMEFKFLTGGGCDACY